jgi:gliding motility-associated lipoprotein GldD
MKMSKRINLSIIFILIISANGCRDIAVPRPKGYFRIDLPEKKYLTFNENNGSSGSLPISFEYPAYGQLNFKGDNLNKQGWFNIEFPAFKAKIYLTYRDINNDLDTLLEQTYKLNVRNHITKADAINEQVFNNEEKKVYGILYDLKGNTASAVQFYLTDSLKHYLRGSLYFAAEPDKDSLAPVIEFFREDVMHLIETLEWKK